MCESSVGLHMRLLRSCIRRTCDEAVNLLHCRACSTTTILERLSINQHASGHGSESRPRVFYLRIVSITGLPNYVSNCEASQGRSYLQPSTHAIHLEQP